MSHARKLLSRLERAPINELLWPSIADDEQAAGGVSMETAIDRAMHYIVRDRLQSGEPAGTSGRWRKRLLGQTTSLLSLCGTLISGPISSCSMLRPQTKVPLYRSRATECASSRASTSHRHQWANPNSCVLLSACGGGVKQR